MNFRSSEPAAAFQLTHSRGVRLYKKALADGAKHFNSRTHVECDRILQSSHPDF